MNERIDTDAIRAKWVGPDWDADQKEIGILIEQLVGALEQERADNAEHKKRLEQFEAEHLDDTDPQVRPMTRLEHAAMDLQGKLGRAEERIRELDKTLPAEMAFQIGCYLVLNARSRPAKMLFKYAKLLGHPDAQEQLDALAKSNPAPEGSGQASQTEVPVGREGVIRGR